MNFIKYSCSDQLPMLLDCFCIEAVWTCCFIRSKRHYCPVYLLACWDHVHVVCCLSWDSLNPLQHLEGIYLRDMSRDFSFVNSLDVCDEHASDSFRICFSSSILMPERLNGISSFSGGCHCIKEMRIPISLSSPIYSRTL